MNYSVVLCFFNEIKRVQKSLEKIIPYFLEKNEISQIFIVDNNSTDGTKEYLKDLVIEDNKITKIFNEKNLGKGGSIKKAILKAKTDYLIIFDPDLEYDEKELDYLIEEINNKQIDFLLGNRIHQNKNFIYKKNYFGVIILTKIINFLFGTKITDSKTPEGISET